MSSLEPSDMDTSSSPLSSPTLSARPLASTPVEHPLYYFHDGSLAFELEGVNYCVHSSLLARHCDFTSTWAQDLRDPVSADISRMDLDAFFSMIYLATYEYPDLDLPAENWASILRLAARWKSEGMRALAITKISGDLSPFEKLVLCRKYDISSWLAPACAALALRPTPLTMEEAEQLEKSDIMRVFLAREAVAKGGLAATEEAISAWIVGFLSKSSDKAVPAPIAAVQKSVSESIPTPSTSAAYTPSEPATTSLPVSPTLKAPETTAEGTGEEGKEKQHPSPSAGASASSTYQGSSMPSNTEEAAPGPATSQSSTKASYAAIAEAAPRPALNANASPFRLQTYASLTAISPAGPSSTPSIIHAQPEDGPIAPVRTPEQMIADAVEAMRGQRWDEALDSLTLDNLKTVAIQVAPSLIQLSPTRPGVCDVQRLQHLLRAIIRRILRQNPGYSMQCGAQFMAALATRSALKSVRFENVLHDDMQSLSSRWATFRAGGQPAVDHGGFMVDLSTNSRTIYQNQMGHGRGLFRTLVRLGVLPATDKFVEMLVQSHPLRPIP